MTERINTGIFIRKDLLAKLKYFAKKHDRSQSRIIERALEYAFSKEDFS